MTVPGYMRQTLASSAKVSSSRPAKSKGPSASGLRPGKSVQQPAVARASQPAPAVAAAPPAISSARKGPTALFRLPVASGMTQAASIKPTVVPQPPSKPASSVSRIPAPTSYRAAKAQRPVSPLTEFDKMIVLRLQEADNNRTFHGQLGALDDAGCDVRTSRRAAEAPAVGKGVSFNESVAVAEICRYFSAGDYVWSKIRNDWAYPLTVMDPDAPVWERCPYNPPESDDPYADQRILRPAGICPPEHHGGSLKPRIVVKLP